MGSLSRYLGKEGVASGIAFVPPNSMYSSHRRGYH